MKISGLVTFIGNYLAVNCWATHVVEDWRDIKHLCFDLYVTCKYDSFCVQMSEQTPMSISQLNLHCCSFWRSWQLVRRIRAGFRWVQFVPTLSSQEWNTCQKIAGNSVSPSLQKRFSLWVSPHFSLQPLGGLWRFFAKTTDVIVGHRQSRAI